MKLAITQLVFNEEPLSCKLLAFISHGSRESTGALVILNAVLKHLED